MREDPSSVPAAPVRVLDLLAVVAAVAVGLAGAGLVARLSTGVSCWARLAATWATTDPAAGEDWLVLVAGLGAAVAVALAGAGGLILGWARLRTRRSGLDWQVGPGLTALRAATTAAAVLAAGRGACRVAGWSGGVPGPVGPTVAFEPLLGPPVVALAILASWAALATGPGWQARADWDDRLGRLVAACWLVLAVQAGTVDVLLIAANRLVSWF